MNSYPSETSTFLNPNFCKFATKNGFAAVGFVDNPSGSYSRLQCLTITEFRSRREEHGNRTDPQAPEDVAA